MVVTRREAITTGLTMTGLAALPVKLHAAAQTTSSITAPRVCGLTDPLALGDLPPRFSWRVTGAAQTAWRIRVASSSEDLALGRNLLWDSGKVASSASSDIAYGGKAVTAGQRAVWQVEVWRGPGLPALHSAPAVWETGVASWEGEWLAAETEAARLDRAEGLHWITGEGTLKADQVRGFRWTFESARTGPGEICISAHELVGLWLDGQALSAPQGESRGWTQMAVHSVELTAGRHVLTVAVRRKVGFGVPPPVLAVLLRDGIDLGERRSTNSPGWKTGTEPPKGWEQPGFDDSNWSAAVPATGGLPIGQPWPLYPASRLRREFTLPREVRQARLYATALGCYEASINGARVGDARLAPEFTHPGKRVLYQAYDVTTLLSQGANCIGLEVADGWYGSKFASSGRYSFGAAPCRVLAQLEIEFIDGTRQVISTGPGWQLGDSPVRSASIYDGEVFDARLEQAGWSRPGAQCGGWPAAQTIAPPLGVAIDPQRCPPVRAHEVLRPAAIKRLGAGRYVADFAQNFAGWPRLTVTAPAGTRIEMKFAELAHGDGSIDRSNLRTALARDVYIAAGQGREVWEPRYTYHGFRYVELNEVPDDSAAWSIEGLVGHQDLALTGDLRVGDPMIRKFWENSVWSQKSNFFGLPTDCPQRDERLGWMGDAQVFWPAAAFNMDTQAFTARVCDDLRATQRANGGFVDCIPPFVPGSDSTSPGWADAGIMLPHTSWWQFGDCGVVAANWQAMARYMAMIVQANPDHLWVKARGFDYGDWLSVDAPDSNPGLATTPKDLIATAYWARNAAMMASMAAAIGQDSTPWRELFEAIRNAFNTKWVRPDGSIGNGSQTGHVLAIAFGLLDDQVRAAAGRNLAADIARRGNHLSTGFLGTPHILDALALSGQEQVAVTLLTQRSAPSWGYMAEHGATTMWERWNSDKGDVGMNSRNHYAFGAIGAFLFRRIAGIDPVAPGFARLRVAPILDPRLQSGGATYRSVRGTIRTDWTVKAGHYKLDVELPPAVAAEVHLPTGGPPRVVAAKAGLNRFSGTLPA